MIGEGADECLIFMSALRHSDSEMGADRMSVVAGVIVNVLG